MTAFESRRLDDHEHKWPPGTLGPPLLSSQRFRKLPLVKRWKIFGFSCHR
jgi:hypothetical protein